MSDGEDLGNIALESDKLFEKENGKVKFTAKPVDDKADSFFMRVKVLP